MKALRGSEKSPTGLLDDQSGRSSYVGDGDKDAFRNGVRKVETDADRGSMAEFERRRVDYGASSSASTTARSSAITANSSTGSINELETKGARSSAKAAALTEVPIPSSSSAPSNPMINPFKKIPAPISTKHPAMTPLSRASPLPSPKESPSGSKDMAGTNDASFSSMSYDRYHTTLLSPYRFHDCLPCHAMLFPAALYSNPSLNACGLV